MAKQYFVPGDGMINENGSLREYFIPGNGMANEKSISGGWSIADLNVAIEMDNLTINSKAGTALWSMFLVL